MNVIKLETDPGALLLEPSHEHGHFKTTFDGRDYLGASAVLSEIDPDNIAAIFRSEGSKILAGYIHLMSRRQDDLIGYRIHGAALQMGDSPIISSREALVIVEFPQAKLEINIGSASGDHPMIL